MDQRRANIRWLLSQTILNTVILCMLCIPAVRTDPLPQHALTWAFYLTACLSQNILFACIFSALLFPFFYWGKNIAIKVIITVIPLMSLLLLSFLNSKIFAFWRCYVNSNLIQLYFSKGGGSQVFEINSDMYVWIVSVATVFFILSIFVLWLSRRCRNYFHFKSWFVFFAAVYVISQLTFTGLCAANNMQMLQYVIKIPYFYNLSWAALFPKQSLSKDLQRINLNDPIMRYPKHPLQYQPLAQKLNVLLIVVDSLRFDRINPINMPAVFQFSHHTNRFMDNISGGDCTKPGIFSLFYGIPDTYWKSALHNQQTSIIMQAFEKNHYDLKLLGSAPLSSPPFNLTVFAHINHVEIFSKGKTALDRDEYITQHMDHFLKHEAISKHPFFGFIFYDAPHAYNALTLNHPFSPVKFLNYFSIDSKTARTPIYHLYENAVYADDQMIQKLLKTLQSSGLMKNTVVILTSDHGQEFNEYQNNYWEHASGFSKYQVRTPLLIAWPNRANKVYRNRTTHFDLAPTLLKRVLGVINPVSDYSVGDDFFSARQPQMIIIGNYAYHAVLFHQDIMQFHHSGLYRWTDSSMNPMKARTLKVAEKSEFFGQMGRYY